jgi:hypothetical protein
MRREAPDTRFFREIQDFNLEFLGLVATAWSSSQRPVFGLDSSVMEPLAHLNSEQMEAIAAAPCLLAGFSSTRRARAPRIAEPGPSDDGGWSEQARLFAAGLLTYCWQMARRDPLRAALCVGSEAQALVGGATVRDIRGYADRALQHLEARFCAHTRFWPDLVRATRDNHPERLQLARLTAIQAATLEAGRRSVQSQSGTLSVSVR